MWQYLQLEVLLNPLSGIAVNVQNVEKRGNYLMLILKEVEDIHVIVDTFGFLIQ